eukprot:g2992.t1
MISPPDNAVSSVAAAVSSTEKQCYSESDSDCVLISPPTTVACSMKEKSIPVADDMEPLSTGSAMPTLKLANAGRSDEGQRIVPPLGDHRLNPSTAAGTADEVFATAANFNCGRRKSEEAKQED